MGSSKGKSLFWNIFFNLDLGKMTFSCLSFFPRWEIFSLLFYIHVRHAMQRLEYASK